MIKKMILWYTIFIAALVLNQTKAFSQDILIKAVTYGLWTLLIFITYVFYKETRWEDWEKTKTVKIINNGCRPIVDNHERKKMQYREIEYHSEQEWLELRKNGIGGSDARAIMGKN